MIAIVDYGMGNLRSVTNAFVRLGAPIVLTREKRVIEEAGAIVLPGVGAFGKCMENLRGFDLLDVLREQIIKGKPYLGICLGLQMLFESSEEAPGVEGLGLVRGCVKRFKNDLKVPAHGMEPGGAREEPRGSSKGSARENISTLSTPFIRSPRKMLLRAGLTTGARLLHPLSGGTSLHASSTRKKARR